MNDDELRALIRVAIQKHSGSVGPAVSAPQPPQPPALTMSFTQYRLERPADDTMCLIEPAVQCNHCGFCKCHGH